VAIQERSVRSIEAFRRELRDEAEGAWRVPANWAEFYFWLAIFGGFVVALSRINLPLFRFLTQEDRLLEWIEFFGYFTAAVVGAVISVMLWRKGEKMYAFVYALFAVGAVFIYGEAIAWGQHIFGWSTPAFLNTINHQHETTLHNVEQAPFNLVMLGIGLYGSVVTWLVRARAGRPTSEAVNLLTPPLFLTSAFLVLFGYKLLRFTILPTDRYFVVNMGEWAEFCLATALAIFAVLQRRRIRTEGALPWRGAHRA